MDEKDDDSNVMSSIMYRHSTLASSTAALDGIIQPPPLVNSLARDLGTLCKSRAIWHWTTRLLCKENSTYCCYLCSRSQAGRMLSLRAEMTLFSAICICVFLVKYHSFSFWLNDSNSKSVYISKNVKKMERIHASNTWKMLRSGLRRFVKWRWAFQAYQEYWEKLKEMYLFRSTFKVWIMICWEEVLLRKWQPSINQQKSQQTESFNIFGFSYMQDCKSNSSDFFHTFFAENFT